MGTVKVVLTANICGIEYIPNQEGWRSEEVSQFRSEEVAEGIR